MRMILICVYPFEKDFREGNESFFNERERERKLAGVSLVGIHRFEPNRFDRSSSKIVAPAQWLFQSVASDRNLPPLPLEHHFDVILLDRAEQVISSKATLKACV